MRNFYKFRTIVLFAFFMLSALSFGQNSFVQKVEQTIAEMSNATSFSDLKDKYEIAKQRIIAFNGRLGANAQESLKEENRLTKETNEKYYKLFTGRVETYFNQAGNWDKNKVLEFKSDLNYVYENTIRTGYIENSKTFNDIKTAIKGFEDLDKYINQTKVRVQNASLEEKRRIKEEIEKKKLDILLLPYLVLNKGANNELESISNQCDGIAVSSKFLTFTSDGGTEYISVNSVSGWDLGERPSFVEISKEDGSVKVVCPRNSGGERTDWFEIKSGNTSQRIDIKQMQYETPEPQDPNLPVSDENISLSTTSLSVNSNGGTSYISVYGSTNWHLESYASSMMTVTKSDNQISVVCPRNTGDSRSDWFNVVCGDQKIKVIVSQSAQTSFTVSPKALSFSPDGGTMYINVSGNERWQIENDYSSNNIFAATKEGDRVKVVCNRNNTGLSREDWFTIKHGATYEKVTITQSANTTSGTNDNISLSTTSLSVNSYGGPSYISVYGSTNWHLENTSSSMMTVMKQGNQIKVECPKNTGSFRSDWFNVVCGDQKIKVVVSQQSLNHRTPVHPRGSNHSKSRVSYHTFIQPVYGYSLTSQPSAGLMIGGVKRAGWYLKGRTGFFMPYGIGNIHYPDGSNDDQYFLSDEYEKTDLSLTGGLSIRFGSSPLCLNIGGGYENRMVLQKTINGDWVRNNMSSHEGVVAEGSFMFLIRRTESHRCRISISAGFSTLLTEDFMWDNSNMNYSTIELGLGVNF